MKHLLWRATVLDAMKATWYNGKVIGFAVTQFWVPIYVWPLFPLLKNGACNAGLIERLQWFHLLGQSLAQQQGSAGAEWVLIFLLLLCFWTVHLPEDWARLGRWSKREDRLFLCSAVTPLSLVEGTGCTYTKSSISFQTTHLELGTGKRPLQRQLVHLRATAQTWGEFRKERRRRFSSLSVIKEWTSLLLCTLAYWLGNWYISFIALLCIRPHNSNGWYTRIWLYLKVKHGRCSIVHIREEG